MKDMIEKAKAVMRTLRARHPRRAVDAPWPPRMDARLVRLPDGGRAWQLREGAAEPQCLAEMRLTGAWNN